MECKKTKFATEAFAEAAIKEMQKTSRRDKKPVRSYLCPDCKTWHLTSRPSREREEIERLRKIIYAKDAEIKELKATLEQFQAAESKQERNKIRVDERVKQQQGELAALREKNKRLRNDNSDLITKMNSLERKLNAGQNPK